MMKIKIAETAGKKGVKSAYGLQKALNISPTIAARLWKGEFDKIGIGTLEKLCEYLQCQTNDLLEYPLKRAKDAPAGESQASSALPESVKGESAEQGTGKPIESLEREMTTKEVADALGISERTVRDNYKPDKNGIIKLPSRKKNGSERVVRESDFFAFRDSRIQ